MADHISPERRSTVMARVRHKDTTPELIVRRLLHRLGYRYRLHVSGLPGKPDVVFARRRKVIFIHGCFWHGHSCRRGARKPTTNAVYWESKIQRTRERDQRSAQALKNAGWDTIVIWECVISARDVLERDLISFLGDSPAP